MPSLVEMCSTVTLSSGKRSQTGESSFSKNAASRSKMSILSSVDSAWTRSGIFFSAMASKIWL